MTSEKNTPQAKATIIAAIIASLTAIIVAIIGLSNQPNSELENSSLCASFRKVLEEESIVLTEKSTKVKELEHRFEIIFIRDKLEEFSKYNCEDLEGSIDEINETLKRSYSI